MDLITVDLIKISSLYVCYLKVDFKALVVHLCLEGDEMKFLSDDQRGLQSRGDILSG